MSAAAVHLTQAHSRGDRDEWAITVEQGADVDDLRAAIAAIPAGTIIGSAQVDPAAGRVSFGMAGPRAPRVRRPIRRPLLPTCQLDPTAEDMAAARLHVAGTSAMGVLATVGARSAGHVGLIIAAVRSGNAHFVADELRFLRALDLAAQERLNILDAADGDSRSRPKPVERPAALALPAAEQTAAKEISR
ncbi:hypothetical protein FF36_05325 [Frankia torreyi]|uniref:Uncharacterized protein n=1 Tax=Frankia torreyi TaxID=1856 RepID=A0A0D8B849_9ACTN|nr:MULTISPECIES: hypothetical protein [Frankia]KJE20351.1 hypothetical protein FF36_05325 [Frankia torreyi]KQM02745.1 hypothetical protein FF86_105737 [Frankia sp. CpI1-P]